MKPLNVEPLNEQRWAKIEKEIFSELDHPAEQAAPVLSAPRPRARQGWAVGLAFACAAAALLTFVATRDGTQEATMVRVATSVESQHLTVVGAEIDVAPHSNATIQGDEAHGVMVSVAHGSVELAVAHAPKRKSFAVHAGTAQIDANAAHFRVVVLASSTEVRVYEGEVVVRNVQGSTQVRAGSSWTTREAVAPAPPTSAQTDGPSVAPPSEAAREALPLPRKTVEHKRSTSKHAAHDAPRPQELDGSARELYERAARIEGTHPDEASALYFELSQGRDTWAENAMFALGRLELERGQTERGRATLNRYLTLHPKGRNADDARRLLSQAR
jgi:hypothetical protein